MPDGEVLPLCRLRYGGFSGLWGFAIYTRSNGRYEDSVLPSGMPVGETPGSARPRLRPLPQRSVAWSRTPAGDH